jgi:DNA-binding GntR family transcriptional regulator
MKHMDLNEEKASVKTGKMDFYNFVSRIENMILTGAFKPRERLVEATLSERFGIWCATLLRSWRARSS